MACETSIEFNANSHHYKSQPIMFATDEVTLGEPHQSESAPSLAETCHSLLYHPFGGSPRCFNIQGVASYVLSVATVLRPTLLFKQGLGIAFSNS